MKILVGIPKARDIPEFDQAVDNSLKQFDKVIASYYPSYTARRLIRATFDNMREYTHLAICPDDMLPNPQAIAILMDDLAKQDYPVLCGASNLSNSEAGWRIITVSLKPTIPVRENGTHRYDFITAESELFKQPQPIQVLHMGDPFPIIRRDVVKQLSFNNDSYYNDFEEKDGCCEDVVMSYELYKLGIPIYCDLRAHMLHLKGSLHMNSINQLQVGKKESHIELIRAVS